MNGSYDIIGVNYAELRKPDARIAAMIADALNTGNRHGGMPIC